MSTTRRTEALAKLAEISKIPVYVARALADDYHLVAIDPELLERYRQDRGTPEGDELARLIADAVMQQLVK